LSTFCDDVASGRIALVTGGGTGIGKEIARTLGRHGARVCIASRNAEVLAASCAELVAEGIDCIWEACDVREPASVEAVLAAIGRRFGRLDLLVNNAAGNFPAPVAGLSYNGFKAVVDIDLRGTYNVTKAAFTAALQHGGGDIVNISAPFEGLGVALQAHCAAAKSGVDSLTRTCAVEFGPFDIRVNAVAPGAIAATEGMSRLAGDDAAGATCPLGRSGTKADIANAVLFLTSPAAGYISGQVLCVDGAASVDFIRLPSGVAADRPGP